MIVLAHLLPLCFGVVAYGVLMERPRGAGGWLRASGYGYLVGMAAAAGAVAAFAPRPAQAFAPAALVLLAGTALLALYARRTIRTATSTAIATAHAPPTAGSAGAASPWTPWLAAALVAWLALRGISLAVEVGSREVFAWDAWSTWCVKARTWILANEWLPFTGSEAWSESVGSRFIAAHHYPDGIAYVQVWFASAAGAWNEPAIFSFWPACWLAGMAILAGQLRALRVPWWLCLVATYAWASLPLVQTHVALAGYVDLPMTVAFGAAALALARALAEGDTRLGMLGLVLALALPLLKHEGALWLLVLAISAVLSWLASRHRLRLAAFTAALVLLALLTTGVRLWLPALGWIDAQWGELRVPALSLSLVLEWRPVQREVIGSLLLGPNWHLLWWLAPVVALATRPCWFRQPFLGSVVALALACVFLVFFFTDASAWAQDLTAVNRVLMQVTMALIAWLACMVAAARDRHAGMAAGKSSGVAPVARPLAP